MTFRLLCDRKHKHAFAHNDFAFLFGVHCCGNAMCYWGFVSANLLGFIDCRDKTEVPKTLCCLLNGFGCNRFQGHIVLGVYLSPCIVYLHHTYLIGK